MKNICFLVSEGKTKLFFEISKYLNNKYPINIFWISPNNRWEKWLIKKGIKKENILNLSKKYIENKNSINYSEVINKENKYNCNFSKIISFDRNLRNKNFKISYIYLSIIFDEIEKFLVKSKIMHVFSEQTWAFEISTTYICKYLSIKSIYLCNTKFPPGDKNGRFTFFEGYKLDKLPNIKNKSIDLDQNFYKRILKNYRYNFQPTTYYFSFTKKKFFSFKKFINLYLHFRYIFTDRYDLTKKNFYELIIYNLKIIINKFINYFFNYDNFENKKNNFLFCFHRYPDSAIDIIGNKNSNQDHVLLNIIKDTPSNININLRFHPHANNYENFFKIKKKYNCYPNVKILNPSIQINELLNHSNYVFSIAGTVSLEAALLGKKSYIMEDLFFSKILNKYSYNNPINFDYDKNQKISDKNDYKIYEFLQDLYLRSYPGLLFNPDFSKNYSNDKNILAICNAFEDYLLNQSTF